MTTKPKLPYTKWITEFFLVVFGVTIALWLENIAEDFKDREIEHNYLISFQEDLGKDIKSLELVIKYNQEREAEVTSLLQALVQRKLAANELPQKMFSMMNYNYFTPEDFTLTSIRESGDFRLLKNAEIKDKILRLKRVYDDIKVLQVNYQQALDNHIVPMMLANVDIIQGKLVNSDFLSDHNLTNIAGYTIDDIQGRISASQNALKLASELKTLLESK